MKDYYVLDLLLVKTQLVYPIINLDKLNSKVMPYST